MRPWKYDLGLASTVPHRCRHFCPPPNEQALVRHRIERKVDESTPQNEVPLAVVRIVPCKVTAENGPIRVGDLLLTSSTAGHAMKGADRSRTLGAVVGKALEPLLEGNGVIKCACDAAIASSNQTRSLGKELCRSMSGRLFFAAVSEASVERGLFGHQGKIATRYSWHGTITAPRRPRCGCGGRESVQLRYN